MVAFLKNAETLLTVTARNSIKLGKKFLHFGSKHVYDLLQKMYDYLVDGNLCDLFTEFESRERFFRNALDCLESAAASISLMKRWATGISGHKWKIWGSLTAKQRKLIKGVIESDNKRYQEHLDKINNTGE